MLTPTVIREAGLRLALQRRQSRVTVAETDPETWLASTFPAYVTAPFAPYHETFWSWVWAITADAPVAPFVAIWPRGGAKALAVDTPIPTPSGWTAMGDLRPGDMVFDHRGLPIKVNAVSGIHKRPAYRVAFADGASLVASDHHRWVVLDRAGRNNLPDVVDVDWAVDAWSQRSKGACAIEGCTAPVRKGAVCSAHAERRRLGLSLNASPVMTRSSRGTARYTGIHATTEELAGRRLLQQRREWAEHELAIPVALPFQAPDAVLPIDPYVLGAWLGDGHSAGGIITCGAEDRAEMVAMLRERLSDVRVHERLNGTLSIGLTGLRPSLRLSGLLDNKHIPDAYLRASHRQRLELLRGLLDTDGTVGSWGRRADFVSTRQPLATGCAELARTLGYRVTISEQRARLYGKDCGQLWRVSIAGAGPEVFGLQRKAYKLSKQSEKAHRWTGAMHYLESVDPVGEQWVQCITVDSPAGMFLAGEHMVPTHNSTSAELACVAVAARQTRRYALCVSETQEQADDHVANVAGMLESPTFAALYPDASRRRMGKYGNSKGWRRNRLRTASGFTLDAIGLDTAARGVKMDEDRPDLLIFDDLDGKLDSQATTAKKITTLTHTLLPAGSATPAVLAVQNLVIPDGIFARLADGRADFLADRHVSGPHPAVVNLTTEQRDGKTVITGGEPTWAAMDRAVCQGIVDRIGISAFRAECQHDVDAPPGGLFSHLDFRHCAWADVPDLVRIVVWVDPAVTDTDQSDAHGIQADGIAPDGTLYRLFSWEQRTSPEDVLRRAILKAVELKAECVGVETDQGGDTWRSVYDRVWEALVADPAVPQITTATRKPQFRQAKAGAGHGPKTERASRMLVDYERGQIVHVVGTHEVLERALRRFPLTKPLDLTDAAYWSWIDVRRGARGGLI